jgi:hypothetical protein
MKAPADRDAGIIQNAEVMKPRRDLIAELRVP